MSLKQRALSAFALLLAAMAFAASPALATPAVNHLGDYEYSNDSTVYYAPCCVSGTASANRVEILTINARTSSSTQPTEPTIRTYDANFNFQVDSRFVLQDWADYDAVGTTDRYTSFVYVAEIGSTPPIAGQIQVDFGTTTLDKYDYTLDEVSGLDTSGVYGGNSAIAGSSGGGVATTSITAGPIGSVSSNDLLYASVSRSTDGNVTPDSAFTELADENRSTFIGQETAYRVGDAANCAGGSCSTASWATSARSWQWLLHFEG